MRQDIDRSRVLRRAFLAGLLPAMLVAACSAPPVAPVSDLSRPVQPVGVYRIVQEGDTLYSLSWAAGVDYRQLAAWNDLPAPYLIRPGQRISLVPTGSTPTRTAPATTTSPAGSASTRVTPLPADAGTGATVLAPTPVAPKPVAPAPAPKSATPAPSTTPAPAAPAAPTGEETRAAAAVAAASSAGTGPSPSAWAWPVRGRLVGRFQDARGYDIAVASGTPVRSTAEGLVVYAGSGLRGYGQLVIVKHSNEYLSAYGHNRKLLVEEGDRIVGGQVIAESGSAPGKGEQVHFEIRRNGQPVDPGGLLPAS